MSKLKIVFMGTPEIAVPSLNQLIESGYEISAVVTQPDRPKGRGKKLAMSPVKELALEKNIKVLQPLKASNPEFIEEIRQINPDVIVVIAFGQILKKELLDIPRLGCINVHVSLLPKYRGAAPINWVIINGEEKTGITTMFMDEGLDTGDIIKKREFMLDNEITAGELHDIMMNEGKSILIETLESIENETFTRTKQDSSLSSYAPIMDKNLGHVNFNMEAKKIHNLVRGVVPWPGAWCDSEYGKIKIWKTEVLNKKSDKEPGYVVNFDKNGIEVMCKDSTILIKEIQMPNKKRMPVSEFIKGNSINIGTILK